MARDARRSEPRIRDRHRDPAGRGEKHPAAHAAGRGHGQRGLRGRNEPLLQPHLGARQRRAVRPLIQVGTDLPSDGLLDVVGRLPAEFRAGLGGVDAELLDHRLPGPGVLDRFDVGLESRLLLGDSLDRLGDGHDAGVLVARDHVAVDAGLAGGTLLSEPFGAADVRAGHVDDVDEVPRLRARFVDGQRLPVERPLDEEVDDRPFRYSLAVDGVLAVEVRFDQNVRGEVVGREALDGRLAEGLRPGVPVERVPWLSERDRERLGVAQKRHTRGKDHSDVRLVAEPRDVVRRDDVRLVSQIGVVVTVVDAADGRQMQQHIDVAERRREFVPVPDVEMLHLDVADLLDRSLVEVVGGDDAPLRMGSPEFVDDPGADVAGRARDADGELRHRSHPAQGRPGRRASVRRHRVEPPGPGPPSAASTPARSPSLRGVRSRRGTTGRAVSPGGS